MTDNPNRKKHWRILGWSDIKKAGTSGIATAKSLGEAAIDSSGSAIRKTLGENPDVIAEQSGLIKNMLWHREAFDRDPENYGLTVNAHLSAWTTAALVSGSGVTALAMDETLSRLTRSIFDGTDLVGGTLQEKVADIVGQDLYREISQGMDTVPESGVIGGGWLHRLQHGHDLAAVESIYEEHGSAGALAALYHIYGRDFFTPAGIPILPSGSEEVHQLLTEQLGLGSVQAADLISINFVELMGGLFSIGGIFRLVTLTRQHLKNSRIEALVNQAHEAANNDDFDTADAKMQNSRNMQPDSGVLALSHAVICHRAGNPLKAYQYYRDAMHHLSEAKEPLLPVDGADISLRGIAATGALANFKAVSQDPSLAKHWTEELQKVSRAGITSFSAAAEQHLDRRFIKRIGSGQALPEKRLSAALNYYLAGQLSARAMVLNDREDIAKFSEEKFHELVEQTIPEIGTDELKGRLEFAKRFVAAELRPPTFLSREFKK